ncbi:hypothetical protein ElyMa_000390300 [Elysia marginata]|uniref:Uncharacterized protein n=1 Tax=Elysia marginata TaxID=1093978 RepID=A0AAV4FIL8_9GAST|nr:hypothetical protein ElyMa_000390300 [Elysia marginata]
MLRYKAIVLVVVVVVVVGVLVVVVVVVDVVEVELVVVVVVVIIEVVLVVVIEVVILLLLGVTTASQLRDDQGERRTLAATEEDTCGNPDHASIKAQLLQNYDIFDSFYKLPRFARASRLPRQNISLSTSFLNDADVCHMLQNQPIGLNGRDPCPGIWILSRDANRVPCLRREFRCLCTDCLLPQELAEHSSNHNAPQCLPIFNYVPVMRKQWNSNTNSDQWTYALDPVVVACTCAGRPNIHGNNVRGISSSSSSSTLIAAAVVIVVVVVHVVVIVRRTHSSTCSSTSIVVVVVV